MTSSTVLTAPTSATLPRPLTAADAARLLGLAALWGLSFPLQHYVAPLLGFVTVAWSRVAVAGAMLVAVVKATGQPLGVRRHGRDYLVLGLVNTAIPFMLFPLALGPAFLTPSALASVINATSPLWGSFFGLLWLRDRLTTRQLLGLALGLAGVVVTTGWRPGALPTKALVGIGLCLAAAACYGWASVFTKRRLSEAPPMGMAASSQVAATLWLTPLMVAGGWPARVPGSAWAIALVIGLACTGLAYLLYYRLIMDLGPARALTVTFLIPVFGVLWSRLLLGEAIGPGLLAGGALVLAGTALVTGFRWRRRSPQQEVFHD